MRVAVGSDHAGFRLKEALAEHLRTLGHDVMDLGTHSEEPVDYPDFGAAVGRAVMAGSADRGVCVCGTGIGISIAANKVFGIRAAVVHDVTSARLARQHNAAHIACFGARVTGPEVATDAVSVFMETAAEGGRHSMRVGKIAAIEAEVLSGARSEESRDAQPSRASEPS
ncbi:MAG: ribose 5-phosphate isomerase B [Actinomycetota bacterium]|nr:ribose 5-phosphate isomerase B [Actinomycetota bacterium]